MRLIDADSLMERMGEQAGCRDCNSYYEIRCRACTWEAAMNLADEAPAIEAVPVVHGHWIENEDCYGDSYYTCSACDCDWVVAYGTPEQNHMQYCPSCGAKMDMEAKDGWE